MIMGIYRTSDHAIEYPQRAYPSRSGKIPRAGANGSFETLHVTLLMTLVMEERCSEIDVGDQSKAIGRRWIEEGCGLKRRVRRGLDRKCRMSGEWMER